ncbi:hypothetical protein [uncultured Thiodictyon sp.]|uniref:hypothetical protein n=1 Tax=uncultured Thiodictyon sp. TaxID=1846217 RepID=UPI0025EF0077|nr:hypothetical protein [uncultured Thiodictyon sp.]
MNKPLSLAAGLLLGWVGSAWPCGGPAIFVPSLHPAVASLTTDDVDNTYVEPFRFLDPFRIAGQHQGALLARIAYEGAQAPAGDPVAADLDAMGLALGTGDRAAARDAARRAIDTLLALPAPLAAPGSDSLRRAVEFAEVEPALGDTPAALTAAAFQVGAERGGTALLDQVLAIRAAPFEAAAATLERFPDSPRRPSLELAALRNRMSLEIGNGWPGQIQGTSAETWTALLAAHDDWLARHPDHPLTDLNRLQRLRILYLQGDGPGAWTLLLELYGRRPARALWEMRHLLRNGSAPQDLDLAGLPDPLLATALLGLVPAPSAAQWDALWRRAADAIGQAAPAPWAINLQERLLVDAATREDPTLPAGFPAEPAKPSERWAQLRTLALGRAGRHAEALRQAGRLDAAGDPRSAAILATALVDAGQATRAATLPALDEDTANFLLHVAVADQNLQTTARGAGPRAAVAAQALAERRLGQGQWAAGACVLERTDPQRAARWREAGRRAANRTPAGQLALAAWLLERPGELFPAYGTDMSRGLKGLLGTPLPPDQQQRLADWLLGAGERQRALDAYGAALHRLEPGPPAAAALAEADQLYNTLLNWDYAQSESYAKLLAASPAARQIRAAGKALHNSPPTGTRNR